MARVMINEMETWHVGEECQVCRSKNHSVTMEIICPDRFEKAVGIGKSGYRRYWVECLDCGLSSNKNINKTDEYLEKIRRAYYEIDLMGTCIKDRYKKIMELPDARSDNKGRVRRIMSILAWLQVNQKETIEVLDIGAGTGVFLATLIGGRGSPKLRGTAIESDPVAAGHLRSLNIVDVIEADFFSMDPCPRYNLITLNKVLEHFKDMHQVLAKACGFLEDDCGALYIEVPDSLTTRFREPSDNILGALHENLYSPKSLLILVESIGLVPVEVKRIREPSGKLTCYIVAVTQKTLVRRELPHEA